MIKPLNRDADERRAEIEALTAAYLSKGGKVTELATTRSETVRPWTGTDADAHRKLASVNALAISFRISEAKMSVLTKEPNFPKPYMMRGEVRWVKAEVKEWKKTWRALK